VFDPCIQSPTNPITEKNQKLDNAERIKLADPNARPNPEERDLIEVNPFVLKNTKNNHIPLFSKNSTFLLFREHENYQTQKKIYYGNFDFI
jgi:hypothetical protein